jgi:predicted HicB family RNase H-like nuclease
MTLEEKQIKTLKIRIEEELLNRIKEEAEKQDTDLSTYVRWCLRTGLYLEDLSQFLQSRIDEE